MRIEISGENTRVEFSIKNFWGLQTVKGNFSRLSGYCNFDPANPEKCSVLAVIEANSLQTGNQRRDNHLRTADFFEVTTYPTITYRSIRAEQAAEGKLCVYGELTIRDVTRPVTLMVTLSQGLLTGPATCYAETELARRDFGLNFSKAPISPVAQVSFAMRVSGNQFENRPVQVVTQA
ncbi:MAG TPA: YceI family protein [Chloroflexia bacterium]|nr:YceI family protein [Chloroflexia bacterium]